MEVAQRGKERQMSFRTKALGLGAAGTIAVAAIATPFIGTWEGLETKPYYDIGGVLTVCYGETQDVEHRTYTREQCERMLTERVQGFHAQVMGRIEKDIPLTMQAAVTSFAYNVGIGAFERSTLLKKINMGDLYGACQELDRWVYVGRTYVRGLANRRAAEKRLCVAELQVPA
jgi:lysozyme